MEEGMELSFNQQVLSETALWAILRTQVFFI